FHPQQRRRASLVKETDRFFATAEQSLTFIPYTIFVQTRRLDTYVARRQKWTDHRCRQQTQHRLGHRTIGGKPGRSAVVQLSERAATGECRRIGCHPARREGLSLRRGRRRPDLSADAERRKRNR